MGNTHRRSFVIRFVAEERVADICRFYRDAPSEHVWPRTEVELAELAENRHLFELVEHVGDESVVVGACYFKDDVEPAEFGGVRLDDTCHGRGLADVLAIVAISISFVMARPSSLIAHVHEENVRPRSMLIRLGFVRDLAGDLTLPPHAPASMKRNAAGDVVGHTFEFCLGALAKFADWLEAFSGTVAGKTESSNMEIDDPRFQGEARSDLIAALRAMARSLRVAGRRGVPGVQRTDTVWGSRPQRPGTSGDTSWIGQTTSGAKPALSLGECGGKRRPKRRGIAGDHDHRGAA